MKTCIDKTCEAVLCEECNDLKPSMCGDRGLQFPKDACDVITFEGVEDVETKQGLCVDLTEGVHAYDGDGTEISYTVEPSEIGCCDVGEHEVTYTAVGKGNKMLPSFCLGKPILTTADCGLMTKVVTRLVTILQSLPPKIIGAIRTVIPVGATFDPLEGVSGIDDNGKETEVTYEGRYDETTGMVDIASVESDIDQNAKHLYVELEPIQDLHGYDKPWAGGAGKNKLNPSFDAFSVAGAYQGQLIGTGNGESVSLVLFDKNNGADISGVYFGTTGNGVDSSQGVVWSVNNGVIQSDYLRQKSTVRPYVTFYPKTEEVLRKILSRFDVVAEISDGFAEAYTPYSNICPIEGHTDVVTQRTGKNLLPPTLPSNLISGTFGSGDVIASAANAKVVALPVPKNTDLVVQKKIDNRNSCYVALCDTGDIEVGTLVYGFWGLSNASLQTLNTGEHNWLCIGSSNLDNLNLMWSAGELMITVGTTRQEYEPPSESETYTTDLGQTVYGGVLDVVTGKMTIEWAMREFDGSRDEAWSFREGANRNRVVLPDVDERTGSYNTDILGNYITATDGADSNPQVWKANINTLGNLLVGIPSSIGNISKWVEYLSQNPLQIAYKLASPQTIRLGKQTIALLQGQNNVWSEDGKVEVVYSKPISGETQFDNEGVYTIYYHTEDECGNETTVKRYLIVGECNTEQAEPILCKGKICCATLDCSENYLVVCDGTVCDGRVGCSSSEPTICNGKICSAKLSCTQTEITPIEV